MSNLREHLLHEALSYPEAWEDFPWEGDLVVKVRKKIFVYLGGEPEDGAAPGSVGLKLTGSLEEALQLDGVRPSGYGLGKHGWVQVPLHTGLDADLLLEWMDESYRTIAPKTLVARLDRQG